MRKLYPLLFLFLLPGILQAQFTLNADAAVAAGCPANYHCFKLTPSDFYKKGSVFYNNKINLNQSFELNTKLYFGNLDGGADGIAFVLQREGTGYIGNDGAGLGYHRFNGPPPMPVDNPGPVPSFIIEFDTWDNDDIFGQDVGDPDADHLGFMSNSNAYHTSPTNLQGPHVFSGNIEDGEWHDARFSWNATTKTMTVTFTTKNTPLTVQTFSYTGDIVNTIFGGDPMVYWGFTASTGSWDPNEHMVQIHMPANPPSCGQLRTQTPGGWGSPPNGNNPGKYLHQHFAAAFPAGLTIGSPTGYTVHFSSAQAITNYLPAGGQAAKLTMNYTDPTSNQLKNVLVSHLLSLTLSLRFDEVDPAFGPAGITLGEMKIGSGPFVNWTVNQFMEVANNVLGGTSSAYTVQQVLETASAINENYVDGKTNKNYLVCPSGSNGMQARVGNPAYVNLGLKALPNPSTGHFDLQYNTAAGKNVQVIILNSNGHIVSRKLSNGGEGQVLRLDLSSYPAGLYYIRLIADEGEQVHKLILQK